MPFIDKPDLKSGFWLGLGVIFAFMFIGFVQLLAGRAVGKRKSASG